MRALLPKQFVERFGTEFEPWSLAASEDYARRLAGAHYENFHVASLLLPKPLRRDFYNIYAFCRWADDLGDEFGDSRRALELLGWWRRELAAMYAARPRHPVFVALRGTVERREIEPEPFERLIRAFELDQTKTRYETYGELLDYCADSANPVGRLVLQLGDCVDEGRRRLSDATCTALQLANHAQDLRRDYFERGRIYLPAEMLRARGGSIEALEAELRAGEASSATREAVKDLVDRAERLFYQGLPLIDALDGRLAADVELFSRGGMAVLDKIRRVEYDVVKTRVKIGKIERAALLARVLLKGRRRTSRAPAARPAASEGK